MDNVIIASLLPDILRKKSNALMQETQNEYSSDTLHMLIGNYAGYIIGVADGIDFVLSLQKQKEEKK